MSLSHKSRPVFLDGYIRLKLSHEVAVTGQGCGLICRRGRRRSTSKLIHMIVGRTQSLTPRILLGHMFANSVRILCSRGLSKCQGWPHVLKKTWPHGLGNLLLFKRKTNKQRKRKRKTISGPTTQSSPQSQPTSYLTFMLRFLHKDAS